MKLSHVGSARPTEACKGTAAERRRRVLPICDPVVLPPHLPPLTWLYPLRVIHFSAHLHLGLALQTLEPSCGDIRLHSNNLAAIITLLCEIQKDCAGLPCWLYCRMKEGVVSDWFCRGVRLERHFLAAYHMYLLLKCSQLTSRLVRFEKSELQALSF